MLTQADAEGYVFGWSYEWVAAFVTDALTWVQMLQPFETRF